VRNALIARTNTRLRAISVTHADVFVDYHSRLVAGDGVTLRYGLSDDGLHPHTVGYEIMAQTLLEALAGAGIETIRSRRL
jgi:lysophospholipase L1-like esterase